MEVGSTSAPARPKRAGLIIGIVLLVASVVVPVTGIVVAALRIGTTSGSARVLEAPGVVTLQLDAGRHGLWAREGRNLTGYDVVIAGPAGTTEYRRFGFSSSTDTITRDGRTYQVDGWFEAPQSGEYAVALTERQGAGSTGATGDRVLVGPPDGYVGANAAIAGLSVLVGIVAFVAGLVVVIVALVGRSRAKRANRPGGPSGPAGGSGYGQPYGTPPAGYPQPGYPPPSAYPQPGTHPPPADPPPPGA